MKVAGKIFDIENRLFFNGYVHVKGGNIIAFEKSSEEFSNFILPGLIDAHVHIESSMLPPSEFSRLVVSRGTVAVVSDPHEIANVMGVSGVEYMIDNARHCPLKCFFGAPSCVPATPLESAGAVLNAGDVSELLIRPDIWFLSEMMNFPGVIHGDADVNEKLASAIKLGKPIDGHAPGLGGIDLERYVSSGISTDHECFTLSEALEKIELGLKIQIREGSAAKNFDALYSLLLTHPDSVMLCTDDSHPDEIINSGHMDRIIRKGLHLGIPIFELIQACVVNPIIHYNLPVGQLRVGDAADFIVVDSISEFRVLQTYIQGELVYDRGHINFPRCEPLLINKFKASMVSVKDIAIKFPANAKSVNVIEVLDGELVTQKVVFPIVTDEQQNKIVFEQNDVLKMVVYNRYELSKPAVGFVKGFGLQCGAIASSVAHDSHHIIAIGTSDEDLVTAINLIVENKGGVVAVHENEKSLLPLPIAGIISAMSGEETAHLYQQVEMHAKSFGSTLKAPFMTLSFMSLLVIPELKLGANGLFDVNKFEYIPLFQ